MNVIKLYPHLPDQIVDCVTSSRNLIKIELTNKGEFIEFVKLGGSWMTRELDKMGRFGDIVEVSFDIRKPEYTNSEKRMLEEKWEAMLKHGFTIAGFTGENGVTYNADNFVGKASEGSVPNPFAHKTFSRFGEGASGTRKNVAFFGVPQTIKELVYLYTSSMQDKMFKHLPAEKVFVYLLQMTSSTKSFKDSFDSETLSKLPTCDIDKWVIVEDVEFFHGNKTVNAVKGGKVYKNTSIIENETDGDGLTYILVDGDVEPFTIRAPGVKGLAQPILKQALLEYAHSNGVSEIIDLWGTPHKIENVDLILTKSAFKWSKMLHSAAEWDEYSENYKKFGHELLVCKQGHPEARKALPAQQMQAIMPTPAEENIIFDKAIAELSKGLTLEGATDMVGSNKWQRAAAKLFTAMLNEQLAKEEAQSQHISKLTKALTGCLPNAINYTFSAPDTIPVLNEILGLNKKQPVFDVNGNPVCDEKGVQYNWTIQKEIVIKEHTICVNLGVDRNGVPVWPKGMLGIVLRNPTPGRGVCVRINIPIPEKYKGFYMGSTCFFPVVGLDMRTLQMDYDGDTVGCSSAHKNFIKAFVSALARAWKKFDYRTCYFENASPKTPFTKDGYNEALLKQLPSEVGLVFSAITTLMDIYADEINCKQVSNSRLAEIVDNLTILEAAGTMIIDAAKNGDNADIQATVSKARELIEKANKESSPMIKFWKKKVGFEDVKSCDFDLNKVLEEKMEHFKDGRQKYVYRNTFMGRYVDKLVKEVPGKLPIDSWVKNGTVGKWVPTAKKTSETSWIKFCSVSPRRVSGLFRMTEKDGVGPVSARFVHGKVEWNGGFGKVVGEALNLKETIVNRKLYKEMFSTYSSQWKKELLDYCMEHNANVQTDEDVLAALCMALYNVEEFGKDAVSKQIIYKNARAVLWDLYGKEMYTNLCNNLSGNLNIEDVEAEDTAYEEDCEGMCFYDDSDFDCEDSWMFED